MTAGPVIGSATRAGAQPVEVVHLMMCCDRGAPRLARTAVRDVATIDLVRDDAVLIASELVANSVLHAGCGPDEQIELIGELWPDALRLTVTDPGQSGEVPKMRGPRHTGPGGNGLRIVDALAGRWGTEQHHGTVVWAELPLAAP